MAKQPKKQSKQPGADTPPSAGGKPKESARQTRTYTLKIRLTTDEREELDAAAEGEALDTSSWARAALLKEARRLAAENQ